MREKKRFLHFRFSDLDSGGTSYGAKELKPLQFLLQPLQNFCVKQYIVSMSIFFTD